MENTKENNFENIKKTNFEVSIINKLFEIYENKEKFKTKNNKNNKYSLSEQFFEFLDNSPVYEKNLNKFDKIKIYDSFVANLDKDYLSYLGINDEEGEKEKIDIDEYRKERIINLFVQEISKLGEVIDIDSSEANLKYILKDVFDNGINTSGVGNTNFNDMATTFNGWNSNEKKFEELYDSIINIYYSRVPNKDVESTINNLIETFLQKNTKNLKSDNKKKLKKDIIVSLTSAGLLEKDNRDSYFISKKYIDKITNNNTEEDLNKNRENSLNNFKKIIEYNVRNYCFDSDCISNMKIEEKEMKYIIAAISAYKNDPDRSKKKRDSLRNELFNIILYNNKRLDDIDFVKLSKDQQESTRKRYNNQPGWVGANWRETNYMDRYLDLCCDRLVSSNRKTIK